MWKAALDLFLKYYSPATTIEESTHQFSTHQLLGMLDRHCGGELPVDELTQLLTEKGYIYDYTHDQQFEWLFKEVQAQA